MVLSFSIAAPVGVEMRNRDTTHICTASIFVHNIPPPLSYLLAHYPTTRFVKLACMALTKHPGWEGNALSSNLFEAPSDLSAMNPYRATHNQSPYASLPRLEEPAVSPRHLHSIERSLRQSSHASFSPQLSTPINTAIPNGEEGFPSIADDTPGTTFEVVLPTRLMEKLVHHLELVKAFLGICVFPTLDLETDIELGIGYDSIPAESDDSTNGVPGITQKDF